MFWTVLAISCDTAEVRGVYTDRSSAMLARDTILVEGEPDWNSKTQYILLEWLSVYGYNRIVDSSGKDIVGRTFFQWVHGKDMSSQLTDAILLAAQSAVLQWAAMVISGSFYK